jgi:hypothetical protein
MAGFFTNGDAAQVIIPDRDPRSIHRRAMSFVETVKFAAQWRAKAIGCDAPRANTTIGC